MYDYDRVPTGFSKEELQARFPDLWERYSQVLQGVQVVVINNYSKINIRVMKGNNQFLSGFTGSIDQMTIVASPDGDRIIKGKIQQMTNPNTVKQQGARSNFKTVSSIASDLLNFINSYFTTLKVTHSPFNSFTSVNTPKKNKETGVTPTFDVEDLQFTRGGLYNPNIVLDAGNSSNNGDGTYAVSFDWDYDAGSEIQDGDDEVFVLTFNTTSYDWTSVNTGQLRSENSGTHDTPVPAQGEVLVVAFMVSTSTGETHNAKAIAKLSSAGVLTAL